MRKKEICILSEVNNMNERKSKPGEAKLSFSQQQTTAYNFSTLI